MQVSRVSSAYNNSPNSFPKFKALHLDWKGAYELATYFVENPGLEDVFMKQLAKPLEEMSTKVRFNSYSVDFITPIKEGVYTLIHGACKSRTPYSIIMGLTGYNAYMKFAHYYEALKNPTTNFDAYNGGLFRNLEAVKNIAEDAELRLKGFSSNNKGEISREGDVCITGKLVSPSELLINDLVTPEKQEQYMEKAIELEKRFPDDVYDDEDIDDDDY